MKFFTFRFFNEHGDHVATQTFSAYAEHEEEAWIEADEFAYDCGYANFELVEEDSMKKTKYYIAYGSNLNMDQMAMRCPDAVKVGTAILEGYKLTFRSNWRYGVANVEPAKGRKVPVGIWAISARDEKSLDRYEGFPTLYDKQEIVVRVNGVPVSAMVYVMTPGHEIAPPALSYLHTIKQGYKDFGFDPRPLMRAAARAKGATA